MPQWPAVTWVFLAGIMPREKLACYGKTRLLKLKKRESTYLGGTRQIIIITNRLSNIEMAKTWQGFPILLVEPFAKQNGLHLLQ